MAWRIPLAVILVALLACLVVQRAVMERQIWTIADIRAADTSGGTVVVKGRIIDASDNRFILDDGTGRAELSTCPSWYKHIDLSEGDMATVVGEAMKNPSMTARCDIVLSVYKIFADGETILVRRRPGKPPWMMGDTPVPPG